MSIKYGKREVATVAEVLDGEFETVEDAAKGVLAAAEEIFEQRAGFVVVGQLIGTKSRRDIPPDDPEAIKVSLGWYSTAGDAQKAAESLWHSTASGDTFRTWVLPVHHGTPADFHQERKAQYVAAATKASDKRSEALHKSIEKHEAAAAKRADALREIEEAAGGQLWPCFQTRIKKGECRHSPPCK